jgi:GGDEF domain-containing protein
MAEEGQSDLQVERELLTIIVSLRLKLDKREAIFCLTHDEDEAPYEEVMSYFVDGTFEGREEARTLWKTLLNYREEMGKMYGQRISLHIAMYHLMRDPEYLLESQVKDGFSCSKIVGILAVQELKAWWERCSETGVHLREVMDQQLERLVYHGLKSNQPVTLVLVCISHERGTLKLEEKGEFARFLMDACRCRDIVGHYQNDLFALIFPQTPRQGARIAVERLRSFFHERFQAEPYVMTFAIANSPENGRQGRELSLVASDTIHKYQGRGSPSPLEDRSKGSDIEDRDLILECEGEPRWLYQCWVFHVRHPLRTFITSPLKVALVLILLGAGIYAFRQLDWNSAPTWVLKSEQTLNESGIFPAWNWGRGKGESFRLDASDGFVSSAGELVIEDLEDLWFSFPAKVQGAVRLSLSLKMSLGSRFRLCFGDSVASQRVEIELTEKACSLSCDGVVMELVPWSLEPLTRQDLVLSWEEEGISLMLNDESLLTGGRWGHGGSWPQKCFVETKGGYVLLRDLKVHERHSSAFTDRSLGRWEQDLLDLGPMGPSAWAEKMLKAPARLEMVLRENLVDRLDAELAGKDQQMKRRQWLEKWGETVLGGPKIWLDWLKSIETPQLRSMWGENLVLRSLTLKNLVAAAESDTPIPVLSEMANGELWGGARETFLKTCLVLDWGPHRLEVAQWVWAERIKTLDDLDTADRLQCCLDYLVDELAPEDQDFMVRICETLVVLGTDQARRIFLALVANPIAMDVVSRWEAKPDDVLLNLLKAKGMALGEERDAKLSSLGSLMSNTEMGKILRYDWIWLCMQTSGLQDRQGQVMYQELSRQSRYPELARMSLGMRTNEHE